MGGRIRSTSNTSTFLVTVHDPISSDDIDLELALYGSFLPIPAAGKFPPAATKSDPKALAGAVVCVGPKIELNAGRKRWFVEVRNEGDRPIQVGSHFNFTEANPALLFDRVLAYGTRLDIAAGTAVRFEPGERKTVQLVQIGGDKVIHGGHGISTGPFEESMRDVVLERVHDLAFAHRTQDKVELAPVPSMDREVVSSGSVLIPVREHVWADQGRPGSPGRHESLDRA